MTEILAPPDAGKEVLLSLTDRHQEGHVSRLQGNYGEAYVRALAASAGLRVSKEDPEPEGVDLLVAHVSQDSQRSRSRAELQIKTTKSPSLIGDAIRLSLRRDDYLCLTGRVGKELDIPRFLVLVVVPTEMVDWASPGEDCLRLNRQAFWADLMGPPLIPAGQHSLTVSVPCTNLLTPTRLLSLVCQESEGVE